MKQLFDKPAINAALAAIIRAGQVFEIRILEASTPRDTRPQTWSGYFNDPGKAAHAIATEGFIGWAGCYFTPNPVAPELLARAVNKLRPASKTPTTGDADIVARHWLLIDFDPVRPTGCCSTETERELARARMNGADAWLADLGFPKPIFASSGNGYHLMYRIELPPDDGGLVGRGLKAIAREHGGDGVTVDTSVANPARIWRLYGTMNCKGDADAAYLEPPRPWRMAAIIDAPKRLEVVSAELLERVASLAPKEATSTNAQTSHGTNGFDLDTLLARAPFALNAPVAYQGGRKWTIPVCPWSADHTGGSAFLIQRGDGVIQAGCRHNSCQRYGWHELRDILEPGWRERKAAAQWENQQPSGKRPATEFTRRIIRPDDTWRPFPTELLPRVLRNYVREIADSIQCDESFVALPLLVTVATAIGATRRLRLSSTWNAPAILWACLLGASGCKKSPPLNQVKSLLGELQNVALRDYATSMSEHERALQLHEADYVAWKNKGRKAGEPAPEKPQEPTAKRSFTDNTTLEALAKVLSENPRGVSVLCDELGGWLCGMGEYKGQASGDSNRWLELYNGNGTIIDRRNGGVMNSPRSAVSVCGGTQPETLTAIMGRSGFKSGMMPRFLVIQPPQRIPRWMDQESELQHEQPMRWRVAELLELQFDTSDPDNPIPVELRLADDARPVWRDWYDAHNREQAERTGDLGAAWSKLEGYAARLALVLALAANPDATEIGRDTLEAACRITDWFKHEAERVYAELALTNDQRDYQQTIRLIERQGGRIRASELQRADRRFRHSTDDATAELETLASAGLGTWETIPPGATGGKPTREFVLIVSKLTDDSEPGCLRYPNKSAGNVGIVDNRQSESAENEPIEDDVNRRLSEVATGEIDSY